MTSKNHLLFLLLLVVVTACHTKTEAPCDCRSDDAQPISDSYCTVFMNKGKPLLICLDKGYVTLCDADQNFDIGAVLYQVNGNVKSKCVLNLDTAYAYHETYIYQAAYFKLDTYQPYTQTLLHNPITWKNFKIEIIRSEDYDYLGVPYPKGFGFIINNLTNDFNFFVPILPVPKRITCSTEQDALKAAFLYVSKMYVQSRNLVDVLPEELQFIGVYNP